MVAKGANANAGEIIAGRYRVEGWVGQGNMAMVFRATHLGTGRPCALKLIHAHLVEEPKIQEMFIQEARVGGRIGKNPFIVDVFDAGIDSDRGVPFLAMDLLEGTTLDKYIKEYGQMPPGLLKTLWLQLAEALEQAHAAGVVHRDLKPGNLFLTYDRKGNPQLRIVDFGIAKLMEEGVQRTATQIGSPAYAAPEQLGNGMRKLAEKMGYSVGPNISPATDIWALGVMTYELLIGAIPGQLWTGSDRGNAMDLLVLVATGPTPSARERAGSRGILLPLGFDGWLERCLQKDAADRWPSIELAVQNLIALFDAPSPRLGTLRLPPISAQDVDKPKPAKSTVLLPSAAKSNAVQEGITSTPNDLQRSTFPASRADVAQTGDSAPREVNQQGASELGQTNSPALPPPRIDGTNFGVTETVTPKRAKRVQRLGLLLIGALFSVITLVFILGIAFPRNENMQDAVLPTAPTVTTQHSALDPQVTPITTSSIEPPLPPLIEPKPAPTLPSAAPLPSLWGRMPTPTAATSAAPPVSSVLANSPMPPANDGTATLNINSIPVSKIIVNGKPMGNTPKVGVTIPPGSYTVVFIHPEKGKKTASGTIKAGETKVAAVKF